MTPLDAVYATEDLPPAVSSSIFLAGPTPRDPVTPSWRPEALRILEALGYRGTVILPEDRSGLWRHSYDAQVEWEVRMRAAADIIVFWIPRDMSPSASGAPRMPALTTNVEFGIDVPTGKVLYGRPPGSGKNKYLDHHWQAVTGTAPRDDLAGLLGEAVMRLGAGTPRSGSDRFLPASLLRHPGYRAWAEPKAAAGHGIGDVGQLFSFPPGTGGEVPWLTVTRPGIEVAGEGRRKTDEIVISRPDISAVAAFHDGPGGPRILLVEEFRTAAATSTGKVIELPGGSEDGSASPLATALMELREETGLEVEPGRLVAAGPRQVAPTLLSHSVHLFALLLSDAEAARVDESVAAGLVHGADEGERITLRFPLVQDLEGLEVDWGVLGMVARAAAVSGVGIRPTRSASPAKGVMQTADAPPV